MREFTLGILSGMVFVLLLFLVITRIVDASPTSKFYTASRLDGYHVCINPGSMVLCINRPFKNPIDAEILTEELNRDMEGNWEK